MAGSESSGKGRPKAGLAKPAEAKPAPAKGVIGKPAQNAKTKTASTKPARAKPAAKKTASSPKSIERKAAGKPPAERPVPEPRLAESPVIEPATSKPPVRASPAAPPPAKANPVLVLPPLARARLTAEARSTLFNRALQQFQSGALAEAAITCKQMIEADGQDFDALHLGGVVALNQGDHNRALELIQRAVQRRPGDAQAQQNLGALYARLGRLSDAEACFRRALAIDPNLVDANSNLGLALASQSRHGEAIACYRQALAREPRHAETWSRLGLALAREHKLDEALPCFRQAVALRPNYGEGLAFLYHQLQHACEWGELPLLGARLDRATQIALAKGVKPGELPFVSISRSMDSQRNFAVAKAASDETQARMQAVGVRFPITHPRTSRRIVLGYLSGDYRNHPVAHLLGGLLGAHDRERFQVNAYSYGLDDASDYRKRAQREADAFVDLRRVSSLDAARRIYGDEVDILIDLTGRTGEHRLDICALRPAPIQVSWLGYPGTSGAAFMDYVLVDPIVAPPQDAPWFSEKLAWLPHCYQINHDRRPVESGKFSRKAAGLPEQGFVFACFANNFKIEPEIFASWMSLLRRVAGSVLWLLRNNLLVERNLKQAASSSGIEPSRLVFADKLGKEDHLSRLALADLALDTRIYTGHTTTSDALWAGLPVVTIAGGHFASRVSASILTAAGLPEMITSSLKDYEALALRLAGDPAALAGLRARLAGTRGTVPLFDGARFVAAPERAYQTMWQRFNAGEAPQAFAVPPSAASGPA